MGATKRVVPVTFAWIPGLIRSTTTIETTTTSLVVLNCTFRVATLSIDCPGCSTLFFRPDANFRESNCSWPELGAFDGYPDAFPKNWIPTTTWAMAVNRASETFYLLLNFHSWRHMGHCWLTGCDCSHLTMQCMWKQCEHWPQTSGQSSPGSLQSGQQPSKGIRQIPQLSSFATHFHEATPVHCFMVTFIAF